VPFRKNERRRAALRVTHRLRERQLDVVLFLRAGDHCEALVVGRHTVI
jgi:hypothetical protein